MADVFISYKRQERDRCERVARKLRALLLDVWFDANLEAGKSFPREIDREVRAAKAVLVLWSPRAVASDWVLNEATIGQQRGVLVAVQLAPCELPVSFVNTHFEVLPDGDFPDDDPAWLKVLGLLGRYCDRQGLAEYAAAVGQWRRRHPSDPLAKGAPTPSAPVRVAARRSVAPLVAVAAVGALVGGLAGAALNRPAAATAEEAAAALVGRWRFPNAACERAVELGLGADGLGFAGAHDPIDGVEPDGAVRTKRRTDGEVQRYRRDGDGLVYQSGSGPETALRRCP